MFRPKQALTLQALRDHLNHLLAHGADPDAKLFTQGQDGALEHPTVCCYTDEGQPDFVVLEQWSDEQLRCNSKHCDTLGVTL